MNKTDLVDAIKNHANISKEQASLALEAVTEAITNTLKDGKEVAVIGFGSFLSVKRPARMTRNPKTGEMQETKESVTAKFKPSKKLKEVLTGK